MVSNDRRDTTIQETGPRTYELKTRADLTLEQQQALVNIAAKLLDPYRKVRPYVN